MDNAFVSYEYIHLPRNHRELHFLLDCYESLGWEQDTRLDADGKTLTLRRSRKLTNHTELTRLQGHLESCLGQMEALEQRKSGKATAAALALGLLGAVCMALSVSAATARPSRMLLCLFWGGSALVLWAAAPVVYKRLYEKASAAATILCLQIQEEIFSVCEKGRRLF